MRPPLPFEELRAGPLGVRIATTPDEIDAVQALRFRVFYTEMGARPDAESLRTQRDRDAYDTIADHLLVIDHSLGEGPDAIVGTYRLIRREAAARIGQFYAEDEYDIGVITRGTGVLLELGRSCVDARYRHRAAMQLLWGGIAAYVFHHKIDLMFGCASLPGTDTDALAQQLSYLYYYHLAPAAIRPRALPHRYIEMRRLDREEIDPKRALAMLPPLIKGYLRLGGFTGDGAVVDSQFNTTDIAVVVKTDLVTASYYRHYARVQPPRERETS